jgi:hypothetical protein
VTRRARVAILVVAVAFSAAATSVFVPVAAEAQTTPPPSLALAAQDPWTPLGGDFTMQLQTGGAVDGLALYLTPHDKLTSSITFGETLRGDALGPVLQLKSTPLDAIPPEGPLGLRKVSFSLAELGITRSGSGVYPVEVQLRDGTRTVTGFVTHIVVVDLSNPPLERLRVAWVWPLAAEPVFRADGTAVPEVVSQLEPTGRLGRQAQAIGSDTDVPLTLAPSPETLDSWSALAAGTSDVGLAVGADDLRRAVPTHQVLSGPFVPLDLPALSAGGLGDRLTDELHQGSEALQRFFGSHVDPTTALPGRLDASAVGSLADAARTQLVVDGSALVPYNTRFTPARPTRLARGNGNDTVSVLATDTGLEQFLTGDDSPALRAAHLLADLALVAGEQPSILRGVAFANPDDWDPSPGFVDAVLRGLAQMPLLQPVTVDELFDQVPDATENDEPDGPPVVRTLKPVDPTIRPPVTAREYLQGVSDRHAIAALFSEADPRVVRADRSLLEVLYRGWENPTGRVKARDLLNGVGQSVHDFLGRIRTPDRSTITLTSSSAQVPLTFRNDADRAVDIHVSLDSDKLVFPDGTDRDLTLQPGKNSTVRIAVETRSSGTFPMLMTVTTAGGLPIQTSEVTVRSSFVSGVGVFLTVGAIVFLVVWWAWDIRRRRRRRLAA